MITIGFYRKIKGCYLVIYEGINNFRGYLRYDIRMASKRDQTIRHLVEAAYNMGGFDAICEWIARIED